MASRIFLVGLMGSGKSFWGGKIAARKNFHFIDLDKFIEEKEGRSIAEIFERHGEAYFRSLEKKYLKEVVALDHIVVATGGGTPCFHANMQVMNDAGETYYLKAKVETIVARIRFHMNDRPLLKGKTVEELPAFLTKQLRERERFYLQAKHTIQEETLCEKNLAEIFC